MTDTQSTTPAPSDSAPLAANPASAAPTEATFPSDVAALIDEAYDRGLDYGPDLTRSTMRLLAKDGAILREVHWTGVGAWSRNVISNALASTTTAPTPPGPQEVVHA